MTKPKKPKAKKADPDEHIKLNGGDYILTEKSGWFEVGELVVHIFVPYMSHEVAVEIFKTDSAMGDEDVLAECSAMQP